MTMTNVSRNPLRYVIRVKFGHPAWAGKLFNLARMQFGSRSEVIKKLIELSQTFNVPSDAFVAWDSAVNVEYVLTPQSEFIASDRYAPFARRFSRG